MPTKDSASPSIVQPPAVADPTWAALLSAPATRYRSDTDTRGEPSSAFAELFSRTWAGAKKAAPMWAPYTLRADAPTRGAAHVAACTLLALDVDGATEDQLSRILVDALCERGVGALLVTSASLGKDLERPWCARLVIGLSRPVRAEEWGEFWWQAMAWLGLLDLVGKKGEPGKVFDEACADVSRAYYTPPEGRTLQVFPGNVLPVDVIRATPVPSRARARNRTTTIARCRVLSEETLQGTAKAWRASRKELKKDLGVRLAKALDGCSFAEAGERDTVAFQLARALVQSFPDLDPAGTADTFRASLDRMHADGDPRSAGVTIEWFTDKLDRASRYVADAAHGLDLHQRATAEGVAFTSDQHNLITILREHPRWSGRLAFDDLTKQVADPDGPWADHRTTELAAWLAEEFGIDVDAGKLDRAVVAVARRRVQHPIRNYLDGVRWDGVPRCAELWTRYFGAADEPLTRTFGLRWMVGAVARIMDPGCKLDSLPIVSGVQGSGKSTGFAALCPDPAWFSDTRLPIDNETRAAEMLRGVWIYEIAELEAFRGREVSTVKSFLSSRADRVRVSYGHFSERYERQAVFVGTTNAATFLSDETGGRRFWPIVSGAVDVAGIARDRDQLWAEAVHHYRAGVQWHLTPPEAAQAAGVQEAAREVDAWEGELSTWAAGAAGGEFTLGDISLGALGRSAASLSPADARRLGKCLRAVGFEQIRPIREGHKLRLWVKPLLWVKNPGGPPATA